MNTTQQARFEASDALRVLRNDARAKHATPEQGQFQRETLVIFAEYTLNYIAALEARIEVLERLLEKRKSSEV